MQDDARWMQQALELARRGRGHVEPNPMVGCLLVRQGQCISSGWHGNFGGPHAEIEALMRCQGDARNATAYVTLEPCCHTNKKTPPCVPVLIAAGITRVVAACADPNPAVSGEGFAQLRQAGIAVTVGVCEALARQLNAAFFSMVLEHRPYVTMKWAQTADGFVAGLGGKAIHITNTQSDALVHRLRALANVVMVGIGTAINDDPLLTARTTLLRRTPPMRVVLDRQLRLPLSSRLASSADEGVVRVYCQVDARDDKISALRDRGVDVRPLTNASLHEVLVDLGSERVSHVFVEPGPTLAAAFIRDNKADRVLTFTSDQTIDDGLTAPAVNWPVTVRKQLGSDHMIEMLNPHSAVYFDKYMSPDLD